MNRVERMFGLVEELRAASPRPRTVPGLARRLAVSERTVQRDLQALVAAGLPIHNTAGRGGGWCVKSPAPFTARPITLSPAQIVALMVTIAGTLDATQPPGPATTTLTRVASGLLT